MSAVTQRWATAGLWSELWCSQSLGARVMSGYLAGEATWSHWDDARAEKRRKTHELVCPSTHPCKCKPFSEPSQKLLMDSFLNWCYIRIGLNLATGINTAITISRVSRVPSIASLVLCFRVSQNCNPEIVWPGCTFSYWYLSGEESTSKLRGAVKFEAPW